MSTGQPRQGLTEAQRSDLWGNLSTLARTASIAAKLVETDDQRTTETMLIDIAVMEAILRRMRRSLAADQPSAPRAGKETQ